MLSWSQHRNARSSGTRKASGRDSSRRRIHEVLFWSTLSLFVVIVVAEYLLFSASDASMRDKLPEQRGAQQADLQHDGEVGITEYTKVGGEAPKQGRDVISGDALPTTGGADLRHGGVQYSTLTHVRDGACEAEDCRVLVTGCGRSGTHFLAEQLINAGLPILHEKIGEAGTVSWFHGAPYVERLRELEEWFSDDASVRLRASPNFQFFPVFHLVRHPLRAISSQTECFCGCGSMRCGGWADPPSWKLAGKHVDFSDRHCTQMKAGEMCVKHNHENGRMLRSMEYWVKWNELVASQAHFRLQIETMNLTELVQAAPQLSKAWASRSQGGGGGGIVKQVPFGSKRSRPKSSKAVTWERMRAADATLEAYIWELAQSYGYSRDPP